MKAYSVNLPVGCINEKYYEKLVHRRDTSDVTEEIRIKAGEYFAMHEKLYKIQHKLDDVLKDTQRLYDIMDEMAQQTNKK